MATTRSYELDKEGGNHPPPLRKKDPGYVKALRRKGSCILNRKQNGKEPRRGKMAPPIPAK